MTDEMMINSDTYWNYRFAQNWKACNGPDQSRFFANLAIEHLPHWLIKEIKRGSLSLADWGCAQGDGTDAWANYIGTKKLVGVDFSSVAIEQATKRYPAIRFINEDWLSEARHKIDAYDIIFTSNTLEHFYKPYDVLSRLCSRAKKAIVLALPYREMDRIDEHLFSFLPENLSLVLHNGFILMWAQVVDCRKFSDTHWGGDQIVLLYADPKWVDNLELRLSDLCIDKDFVTSEISRLNAFVAERDGQIADLNQEMSSRTDRIRSLEEDLVRCEEQIADLNQNVVDYEAQISGLSKAIIERDDLIQLFNNSYSWRLTRPLRIANRLVRSIWHKDERYRLLKSVYWCLPEFLRHQLNRQRYAYVAKNQYNAASLFIDQNHSSVNSLSIKQNAWLKRANQAERIVVIPCSFEFDELVNQRPINAAKYFSAKGYFVLFIAWQWSPQDILTKGCSEVWSNVYQVPLFDFIAQTEKLGHHSNLSIFLITFPAAVLVSLIPCLRQRGLAIVYDVMDEWEAFYHAGQAPWFTTSVENSLVLQADYVCAVSPALRDKFSNLRSDISVIGNGYTPEVLGLEQKGIAGTRQCDVPVIGYFGHLTDSWFDWKLVFHLARHRTDVMFEIIGYGEPDWVRREAAAYPNIHLLGKVVPMDLHHYTAGWTAGIIPFVEGDLADAVDPIKIYEYLYFGLPTIVTGIRHLKDYPMTYFAERKDVLHIVDNALQFKHRTDKLDNFLQQTNWSARFDTLMSQLNKNQNMRCLYGN